MDIFVGVDTYIFRYGKSSLKLKYTTSWISYLQQNSDEIKTQHLYDKGQISAIIWSRSPSLVIFFAFFLLKG